MIFSAALFVLAVLLIGGVMLLQAQRAAVPVMRDFDVYAEQLRGLERDLAKGVLRDEEFAAMRAEIGRRMISAARASGHQPNPSAQDRGLWAFAGGSILACLLGAGLYSQIGAPSVPNSPIAERYAQSETLKANRLTQETAEARAPANDTATDPDYVQLVTELRAALEARPEDIQGHELLAKAESRLGNFASAHQAQARVLELKGAEATADEWYAYAELLIMAADTYISREAETALREALRRDPNHKLALFRMGMYFDAIGRPDRTFGIWRKLLDAGPETAPYIPLIRRTITDLAQIAGVNYDPPAVKGPSAEDMQSAAEMSAEDRSAMIASMVTGLADRLATEGGPAPDWAQLIVAYGVLGETTSAREIFDEAVQVFESRPGDLEILQGAAQSAGIWP
ncbi:c-type cytochrome biogenesis protein CcmI [Planktomarina temperata]|nr:c-type cytochrome biogenesis protein CcmI [Planktomarina temperata]